MSPRTLLSFVTCFVATLLGASCHSPQCATAPDPPVAAFSGIIEPGAEVTHELDIRELLNGDVVLRWSDPGVTLALGVRDPACGPGCTFFNLPRPAGSPGPCVGNCISDPITPGQVGALGVWRFVIQNRSDVASRYDLQVSLHYPRCT